MSQIPRSNRLPSGRFTAGFTLIELLVAMTIFAIMSVAMYTVFSSYQQTKEITDRDARRLADLQRFFSQFGREIQQLAPRPVRDEYGSDERLPALQGTRETIEFSRAGWNQPPFSAVLRSELQRVAYALEEGNLVRTQWQVLDRADDTQPIRTPILENVTEVSFKYFSMNSNNSVQDSEVWPAQLPQDTGQAPAFWPPAGNDIDLPIMVQITLDLPDAGKISRTYALVKEHKGQS